MENPFVKSLVHTDEVVGNFVPIHSSLFWYFLLFTPITGHISISSNGFTWLGIRIMCPSESTYQPVDCCLKIHLNVFWDRTDNATSSQNVRRV